MPLSTRSIIEPAEIPLRAPLRKSTVAWGLALLVLIAALGVLAPRLLRDSDAQPGPKPSQPVNTGQTRTIDGEFEDARRRLREPAIQAPQPAQPESVPAIRPLPLGPIGVVSALPPDARRDQNSAVLYGRQDHGTDASASSLEMDAAARSSPGVRHDFGEAPTGAATAGVDPMLARMRALAPEPAVPSVGTSTTVTAASDRLLGLLEAQQRRPDAASAGRDADRAWLQELSDVPVRTALRPTATPGRFTLMQGKVLPAVLGKDLNTVLPGEVIAFTTEDVYDSITSRHLLIPKGALLSGKYSTTVRSGQDRILFAFTRITLPDGSGVDLPGFGGADRGGAAGVEGDVNNHFLRQFGSSLLIALLGVGVERDKSGPAVVAGGQSGAVTAAGQVLVDVSRSALERNKGIEPTITVAKGTPVLVEVTRDITFPGPWRSH